jgi:hypothetical protein
VTKIFELFTTNKLSPKETTLVALTPRPESPLVEGVPGE